jgi:hypothetical protein
MIEAGETSWGELEKKGLSVPASKRGRKRSNRISRALAKSANGTK